MTPQEAVDAIAKLEAWPEDGCMDPVLSLQEVQDVLEQVVREVPQQQRAPRALHAALDTFFAGVVISEVGDRQFVVSCPAPVVQAGIDHLAQIPEDVLMASRAAPQYLAQAVQYIEQRMARE